MVRGKEEQGRKLMKQGWSNNGRQGAMEEVKDGIGIHPSWGGYRFSHCLRLFAESHLTVYNTPAPSVYRNWNAYFNWQKWSQETVFIEKIKQKEKLRTEVNSRTLKAFCVLFIALFRETCWSFGNQTVLLTFLSSMSFLPISVPCCNVRTEDLERGCRKGLSSMQIEQGGCSGLQ